MNTSYCNSFAPTKAGCEEESFLVVVSLKLFPLHQVMGLHRLPLRFFISHHFYPFLIAFFFNLVCVQWITFLNRQSLLSQIAPAITPFVLVLLCTCSHDYFLQVGYFGCRCDSIVQISFNSI
jgi:hypothetical protein